MPVPERRARIHTRSSAQPPDPRLFAGLHLHPFSEHLIDWFHITMRLTVMQQQTKAPQEGCYRVTEQKTGIRMWHKPH